MRNTVQLFRVLACFAAAAGLSQAAISGLQVQGATNVQAAISFQAPVDVPCRLEASEDPNYKPLVHDVNPALFAGADLNNRNRKVIDAGSRIFILGRRAVDQATDRQVLFSGMTPGSVGLYQVNFVLDKNIPLLSACFNQIALRINGVMSPVLPTYISAN